MSIKLESKSVVRGEGVSVKMRKTFRDVRRRESKPYILNGSSRRSGLSIQIKKVQLLLRSKD